MIALLVHRPEARDETGSPFDGTELVCVCDTEEQANGVIAKLDNPEWVWHITPATRTATDLLGVTS